MKILKKIFKLPGIAEDIAYQFYNEEASPIFSFGSKFGFLNEQVREQLTGGMCLVLHRYISLKSDPEDRLLADSAYLAPNGEPYESLLQLDFNSLVSSSQGLII